MSAYSRRAEPVPPKRKRSRSPSPIPRSPPRNIQSNRPRGRGRNVLAEAARLAEERERERLQAARTTQAVRGVQDVSNQFYNARPEWVKERGREWRRNESKIKGLRNFNNWIKSTIIQKFSPEEMPQQEELGWGEEPKEPEARKPLLVLDMGCGKGGDLGKWQLAPQTVGLYVGLDPADQSIEQARDRYTGMRKGRRPIFDGRFHVKDCFGEWIGEVPIVREVGIDPGAGAGGSNRWGGGGQFDVVSVMFSMHYAFESEAKVKMMLRNVAGSLKKGGRFIGVVPNSDALAVRVVEWHNKKNKKTSIANGEASQEKDEPVQHSEAVTKQTSEAPQNPARPIQSTEEAACEKGETPSSKGKMDEHRTQEADHEKEETPSKKRKIDESSQEVAHEKEESLSKKHKIDESSPQEAAHEKEESLSKKRKIDRSSTDTIELSAPEWGNSIYRVRFPVDTDRPTVPDGTFRPPFGWKYMYWMDEAVDVPEYVVPWEAFRALAEGFNLEQRYRKPFLDVWATEKDDRDLAPLSVRMGVTKYEGGPLEITEEEKEAVSFYHAFCFVKV